MAYRISFTRNTKVSTKKVLDFEIQDAVRSLKRGESAHLEYVELSNHEVVYQGLCFQD